MLRFLEWDLNLPTCCYVTELLMTKTLSFQDWKHLQRQTVTSSSKQYMSFREMKMAFLRAIKEVSGTSSFY